VSGAGLWVYVWVAEVEVGNGKGGISGWRNGIDEERWMWG
jgi:hypothetical protein